MRTLPLVAILLGLAGLLPFLAGSYATLAYPDDTGRLALLALAAYGATILAFLGGVHWGVALQAGAGQTARVQRLRFGLSVLPCLLGWAALLVVFVGLPKTGLIVLVAGFVATTVTEARGARAGLVPAGYMGLRWVLSIIVVVCLVSVVLIQALGGRVVL